MQTIVKNDYFGSSAIANMKIRHQNVKDQETDFELT
jgi:hypothetical protein